MERLRLAGAQINPVVGDLDGNVERVLRAYRDAVRHRAHLAVFPELTLTGYPPEDLVFMPAFLAVTVVLLIAGPRRRLPAFYLGGVFAAIAMVLWVYWTTSQPDWAAHIERTALRTVTGPLFLAAAALAHLLTRTAAELPLERRADREEAPVEALAGR